MVISFGSAPIGFAALNSTTQELKMNADPPEQPPLNHKNSA